MGLRLPLPAVLALATAFPASQISAAAEPLILEEVIVTATRRVENLQEVAMSVSAFGNDFIQDVGVNNIQALEQYTPNLTITPGTDSRGTSIRIRGIGSVGTNSGIDPSVGVFIDSVYQGRAGMSVSDLIDVERVEILRGPQGTLYGKNTAAGAITVTTRTPTSFYESFIEATYDSEEQAELRGSVNIPFGDSGHAMRLAGFVVDGEHRHENTLTGDGVNDAGKWGLRSRILFDGNSGERNWGELLVTVDYTQEDTDCCALAVMDYDGLSTLNSPITNVPSAQLQEALGLNDRGQYILQYTAFEDSQGFSPPVAEPFRDDYWFDGTVTNEVEFGGIAVEWNKDLSNEHSVAFINAWRTYSSDSQFDGDFTAYNSNRSSADVELDQYSSELRITSPGGETIDWIGGLYAYYSEFDSIGTFQMGPPLTEALGLSIFFPDGALNTDTNLYTTTSYAAFGNATWNINERLSATLGLRYTYEKKEREGSQITAPSFFIDIPPVAGPDVFYDDERSDSDLSPTLSLRYFIDEDLMVYGLVSRGFKSGGYNQRREISSSNGEFDEEIATNYEIGWKGMFMDRRLQLNGTFFFVEYDDFQSQTFDGSSLRVTNAGTMESYGTEIELTYLIAEGLTFGSAIGYNKAEYDEFDNGQCTVAQTFEQYYVVEGAQGGSPGQSGICIQDLAGEPLDNAPEWTVSSYLSWDTVIGDRLQATLRLEHTYIDEYFLDQDLDENLMNGEVDLVNLRFTLSNEERSWEAALWGRNMLDEEYYSFGIDIPTLGGYAGVTAPEATYGLTLRYFHD
ncbi:MAG: TonB-dependent receptor [Pseudomonadota bacterium]